jgi:hypothetical protein
VIGMIWRRKPKDSYDMVKEQTIVVDAVQVYMRQERREYNAMRITVRTNPNGIYSTFSVPPKKYTLYSDSAAKRKPSAKTLKRLKSKQ